MLGLLDTIKIGAGLIAGVSLTWAAQTAYDRLVDDPAVAAAAREGYVQIAEKTALQAQLAELSRQRAASDEALRAALARAENAKQEAARAQAQYDDLVVQDSGADGARVDGSDVQWLRDY
ncbi:conserved hypothetical protein [Ancylobacter novellus DSM 506]|uniref:Uncharacterized protein n=1 Tax=Ancylobacter novellus (strain ATCC 8093 / DSM 506 / JCM 20403 / CCM 1077 / IAM 12100 / NBRC 12443 / NCIMB 10456) TaxID=639283 RepID=D6ZZV8_ANCN5|nr:hypothetical protein [Ancylobacter novellus]ADH87372.1 conserved hypothetical protein [Ancylobacter novellus DSM 506]